MDNTTAPRKDLYGGTLPWNPSDWTASDDRVRGGASTSFLDARPDDPLASFHGHLDITTLGGAGFASQRTTFTSALDLSAYDGVAIDLARGDGKRYVLVIKDTALPPRDDGREQSSISWESEFVAEETGCVVVVPWKEMKATYRGRRVEEPERLRTAEVRRVGLLMRSFFGQQQGDFEVSVRSIAAVKLEDRRGVAVKEGGAVGAAKGSWLAWVLSWARL